MNVQALVDRLFEVAYFWRIDPAALLTMPLSRFALYEHQAERIAKQINPDE